MACLLISENTSEHLKNLCYHIKNCFKSAVSRWSICLLLHSSIREKYSAFHKVHYLLQKKVQKHRSHTAFSKIHIPLTFFYFYVGGNVVWPVCDVDASSFVEEFILKSFPTKKFVAALLTACLFENLHLR